MQSPEERMNELQQRFVKGLLRGMPPKDLREFVLLGSELAQPQTQAADAA